MLEPKTRRGIGPQLSVDSTRLDFGGQLEEFARKTKRDLGYVHRGVTIKLFGAVVLDTPVLTGAARGSWIPSVDRPASGIGAPDADGSRVLGQIKSVATEDFTKINMMVSNLPYIVPLEYGWSQRKAPEGMVRINVVRFQNIVKEVVAGVRSGKA